MEMELRKKTGAVSEGAYKLLGSIPVVKMIEQRMKTMDVVAMMDELQNRALHEEDIKEQLLATRYAADPLSAFCRTCRELGYEMYEMDVICAGEEFHAAMKRSTNGGGENSPKLDFADDFYELFFASLEK